MQSLLIQKHGVERQLASLPIVEPGIAVSLTGSLGIASASPVATASAGLSLQLSADSFHVDERNQLRRDLRALERDLALGASILEIEELNMRRALEVASIGADVAERTRDHLLNAYREAQHDFHDGQITAYELEDAEASYELGVLGYHDALVDVYSRLADLVQSYTSESE